ncbi:MAG: GyrI-like domain-containing protein [Armatimonadetes bacterium]|nr:GyrI-like domain-containing protein [Armatimonadota bacterium]
MGTEFEIVEVPERPCVFIRRTVKRSGTGEAYMEGLPKVFDYVGKHGKHVNGPLGRYTACSPDELTVEIGVMTETPLDGEGEIESGTFGGFRGLKGVHVGSYDRLHEPSLQTNEYLETQGNVLAQALSPNSYIFRTHLIAKGQNHLPTSLEPPPCRSQRHQFWKQSALSVY